MAQNRMIPPAIFIGLVSVIAFSGCATSRFKIDIHNVHSHIAIGEPIASVENIMKDDGHSVTRRFAENYTGSAAGVEQDVHLENVDLLLCQKTIVRHFVSTTYTIAFVIDDEQKVTAIVTRWDSVGL